MGGQIDNIGKLRHDVPLVCDSRMLLTVANGALPP